MSLDKELKKERIQKLERKLQNRQLTLYEALQEDIAVDWFRVGHPAFLSMLNHTAMSEMVNYIVIPGPPDNKMRSYKIPLIATQILTIPSPKVFDLMFLEEEEAKGGIVLGRLIAYFQTQPNYVISGYVTKILMNLMAGNAPRVFEFLIKNNPSNILNYMESHSIAEFLLRIIIVQDVLLNSFIKERIELFNQIIQIYAENKVSDQALENASFILAESILRLWTQKHKQLGRFSTSLFRIVQLVIENSHLYQQENLISVVMKHLTTYSSQAPFVIIALYKKIYKELVYSQNPETFRNQAKMTIPKFSMKNLKLLQALHYIFTNSPQSIAKHLTAANAFSFLLEFPAKYEWNSIVLVELEKILKAVFLTSNENIYQALFSQSHFLDKLRDLIRREGDGSKFGKGYSGFLKNIIAALKHELDTNSGFGQLIKKNHPETKDLIQRYNSQKQRFTSVLDLKVVHDVAKPYYNIPKLLESFANFFDETQAINKRYQMEHPSMHMKTKEVDVLHEIQNENQLVYKLLTQENNSEGSGKIDSMENGAE